jgi:hypothetical protein
LFGAGGEDKRAKATIFDNNMDSILQAKKKLGWTSSQIIFGSGQIKTVEKISHGFGKKPLEFSSENYRQQIQILIKRIESGEIKKNGNKLIVTMLTHGGEKNERGSNSYNRFNEFSIEFIQFPSNRQ